MKNTSNKKIFIVGNKFHEFSIHENVKTFGEILEMIRTNSFANLPSNSQLVSGQGLTEVQAQALYDQGLYPLAAHGIDISPLLQRPLRVSRLQSHKHYIRNAIISHPKRLDEHNFESHLILDERSELMNDHQTGQHIQGMVLIEAARQMFLAVTEEYFIGDNWTEPYYFVLNSLAANFTGFVFPLDVVFNYRINSSDISRLSRLHFDITISVNQGDTSAATLSFQFTAYHAEKLKKNEHKQAIKLLNKQTGRDSVSRKAENLENVYLA